jgi:hypothetical protein
MLLVAIFGPLLLAVLVALAQQAVYRGLVRAGRIRSEDAPFFGILLFRGFLVALAVVLIVTVALKTRLPQIEDDPFWTPEQREELIEKKYGASSNAGSAAAPALEGEQDQALEAIMDGSEPAQQPDPQQGAQAPRP